MNIKPLFDLLPDASFYTKFKTDINLLVYDVKTFEDLISYVLQKYPKFRILICHSIETIFIYDECLFYFTVKNPDCPLPYKGKYRDIYEFSALLKMTSRLFSQAQNQTNVNNFFKSAL